MPPRSGLIDQAVITTAHNRATPANRMNTPGSSRGHQRAVLMATSGRKPVGP